MQFSLSRRDYYLLNANGNVFVENIGLYTVIEGNLDSLNLFVDVKEAILLANSLPQETMGRYLKQLEMKRYRFLPQEFVDTIELFRRQHQEIMRVREDVRRGLLGVCGCALRDNILRRPYHCGVYERRPKQCRTFEEGGDRCATHFISKRASVAREVVERANEIEPTLRFLSLLYGVTSRQVREFRL